jgi:hypothetical protein
MMRRRRVASDATAAATQPSNLEDTDSTESGAERWAGDPEESPQPAAASEPEPARKDRFPMPWGLVIVDVFNMDVHKLFKRLTDELSLGDGATEYGTVLHALDASARNLYEASCLARKAQLEDEKFSLELGQRLEVLRSAAAASLEQDKAQGKRTKAPTIEDIKDRMLASWPDEVRSINARKAEMHGAFRAIEALVVSWTKRCSALETMAQRHRQTGA